MVLVGDLKHINKLFSIIQYKKSLSFVPQKSFYSLQLEQYELYYVLIKNIYKTKGQLRHHMSVRLAILS